jgi:hypothetical protein
VNLYAHSYTQLYRNDSRRHIDQTKHRPATTLVHEPQVALRLGRSEELIKKSSKQYPDGYPPNFQRVLPLRVLTPGGSLSAVFGCFQKLYSTTIQLLITELFSSVRMYGTPKGGTPNEHARPPNHRTEQKTPMVPKPLGHTGSRLFASPNYRTESNRTLCKEKKEVR